MMNCTHLRDRRLVFALALLASFSVDQATQAAVVADYRDDFRSNLPWVAGWQYLWNAPDGWTADAGVTGDMSTGAIGQVSNYRAMLDAGTQWTADGDDDGTNHSPDRYVRLTSTGGHPGANAGAVFGSATNAHDRYAIAAYTIQPDDGIGRYSITNSLLSVSSTSSNGVEVLVHVNSDPTLLSLVAPGGSGSSPINFNTFLGTLDVGDTIYVALGANGNSGFDSFNVDFSINWAAVPEPSSLVLALLAATLLGGIALRRPDISAGKGNAGSS